MAAARAAPHQQVQRATAVLAYDEHDAKPYRWTYDGSPLKTT